MPLAYRQPGNWFHLTFSFFRWGNWPRDQFNLKQLPPHICRWPPFPLGEALTPQSERNVSPSTIQVYTRSTLKIKSSFFKEKNKTCSQLCVSPLSQRSLNFFLCQDWYLMPSSAPLSPALPLHIPTYLARFTIWTAEAIQLTLSSDILQKCRGLVPLPKATG